MYKKIVLNIPHSSTVMPVNTWVGDIEKEIERWTDKYTDVIFASDKATSVVFPYSRFYCDAERLINDPMEEIGQGIFYTDFNDCKREMEFVQSIEVSEAYREHHTALSNAIDCDDTILIDCHSFPKDLAPDVDFCIGWNNDTSKPSDAVIEQIKKVFEDCNYKVGLNIPYSNSITPKSDFKYHSVMIEINKKLYLDGEGNKLGSMYKLNLLMNYLYNSVLNPTS